MLRPRQENVSSPTTRRKAEENYATDRETQSLKENRLSKSTDATNKLLQTKDVNQKPQSWQRSTTGKGNEKIALGSPKHKSQVSVFVDKENDAQSTPKSPSKTKTKPAVLRPLTPTKRPGNELSASTPKKSLGSTGKRSSERQPLEHGFQKEEELPYIPDDEVDLDLFDDRIAHDSYGQRSDDSYEEDTILVKPRKFQLDTIEENADLRWSGKADDVHDHLSEETNQASSETSVKERKPLTLDAISDPSVEELLAKMPSEVEYAPPKEQELPYVPDVEVEMPHFSGLIEPLVFDSTLFKNEDDSLSFDPTAEEAMSAALDERSVSEFVLSVANAVEEDASSNDEQDDLDIPFDDFYFDISAALTVTA